MRGLFQPSLVRRVVVALMMGILLAWVAFVGLSFLRIQAQQEDDRKNFPVSAVAVQMIDALDGVQDSTQAGAIAAAFHRIASRQRERRRFPGNAVMQVWDRREQHLVYSSPAVAGDVLRGNPSSRSDQVLHGQPYQVFEVDTNRWSVLWARSLIDNPWVLKEIGVESMTNIAIAIPCLILPMWLAVIQGLRPLRQFSARIAARGHGDLSPVGLIPAECVDFWQADPAIGLLEQIALGLGSLVSTSANCRRSRRLCGRGGHGFRRTRVGPVSPRAVFHFGKHVLVVVFDDFIECGLPRLGHTSRPLFQQRRRGGHQACANSGDTDQPRDCHAAHFTSRCGRRGLLRETVEGLNCRFALSS